MRVTIFGATGETGRMLTQLALAEGYEVVAYARNPANYIGERKVNLPLSRADLVDFLLAQLEDDRFIQKAPAISN